MNPIRGLGNLLLASYLQAQSREAVSSKTNNIAILFSAETLADQEDSFKLATHFSRKGFRPYLLGFVNKRLDPKVTYSFPHYGRRELGYSPFPKGKSISFFLQKTYHTAINLDQANHISLQYITHKLKANYKVAIGNQYKNLYDIVLEPDATKDASQTIEQTINIIEKVVFK